MNDFLFVNEVDYFTESRKVSLFSLTQGKCGNNRTDTYCGVVTASQICNACIHIFYIVLNKSMFSCLIDTTGRGFLRCPSITRAQR